MTKAGRNAVLLFFVLVSVWIPKEAAAKDFSLHAAICHGRKVLLQWDKCPGASGYLVLRGADKEESGVPVATLGSDVLEYTDTTLAPGDTGYYRIEAVFAEAADSETQVDTNPCKIYLSGKPDTPSVKIRQSGRKLKFQITHLTGSEAVYLYGKKKGGRYQLYSITKDSYQMFVEKDTAKFILKAQSARGIYFFRIRSYRMVKGKKIYSAYSEERKVRFD